MASNSDDRTESFEDLPTQGLTSSGYLGTRIKDRYHIEKELGRGGFGVVYLAKDLQLHSRPVVVKVLTQDFTQDPWTLRKFRQEIEALARIDHPGIVGALDTGETEDGKPFLVMQYVEGVTLRSVLVPGGLPLDRVANIARQMGQALSAAHEKGVWHRDLKPENIMLSRVGEGEEYIKLIDFGIAAIKDSQFSAKDSKTTRVAGSFAYMSPEQFQGKPCAQSDVWAFGIIVWEMAAGTKPFPADSLFDLMIMQQQGVTARPRDERADLPAAAEQVLLKALAVDPAERFQQPREFGEAFARALTEAHEVDPNSQPTAPLGVPVTFSQKMAAAGERLEIAHVLFVDLVGYSTLPMDRQRDYLSELQHLVRDTAAFRTAEQNGELLRLPTGDGVALTFFGDPTAPVECAVQLARALKSRTHLNLRIGIHTGPVYRVADINANMNVAGGGINTAQRVMNAGDPGHILVSDAVANILNQLGAWRGTLHDLGEYSVKHDVKLRLYNLVTEGAGNPLAPSRLRGQKTRSRRGLVAALCVLAVSGAGAYYYFGDGGRSPSFQRQIEYSITTQKFKGDKPDGPPSTLMREMAFTPDVGIWLNFKTEQAGHLYLLNVGPKGDLVFLRPNPSMGVASAISSGEAIRYPEGAPIRLDREQGVEQLYLVWSAEPVRELDLASSGPGDSDKVNNHVVFRDPARIKELLAIPEKYLGTTTAEPDESRAVTILRSTTSILARRIRLEHI
jgi:serine/threonine protein kinase